MSPPFTNGKPVLELLVIPPSEGVPNPTARVCAKNARAQAKFDKVALRIWKSLIADEDGPLRYKGSGRLPAMKFYANGSIALKRYVTIADLEDIVIRCYVRYYRGHGMRVEVDAAERLIEVLNNHPHNKYHFVITKKAGRE